MKRNTKYRTDFLFPKPSFLEGMGMVLNIMGMYHDYNTSESDIEADHKAIKSDWGVVGQDMKNTIRYWGRNGRKK